MQKYWDISTNCENDSDDNLYTYNGKFAVDDESHTSWESIENDNARLNERLQEDNILDGREMREIEEENGKYLSSNLWIKFF